MTLRGPAQVVQEILAKNGSSAAVMEFPQGTRTMAEAAAAIGVDAGQIAKSLLFISGDAPILVVASGSYRIDLHKLKNLLQQHVRQAKPDEVTDMTGFPIGGVSPIGSKCALQVVLDTHLWDYPVVYAAAGTPTTAFATTGDELLALTKGIRADVAQDR